jgi:hypothetical protein
LNHFLQAVQRPAVHFQHPVAGDAVRVRLKVVQIAQDETAGVADAPVGLHQPLENLFGNPDVVGVILRRHPRRRISAPVFGNGFFRADDVAHGLGHFPCLRRPPRSRA